MSWGDPDDTEFMPLWAFSDEKRQEIADAVAQDRPPARWLKLELVEIESRAWYEWFWARGRDPLTERKKIPAALRRKIIERDGLVCGICDGDVEASDVHIDHIFPVAHGGSDDPENLRVSHSACNIKKGAKV